MQWETPPRPADVSESRLIEAFLSGRFPINSTLPPERELAAQLGITRPTLREALQRLARDGWIEIHQGRPTRVRDYWREGSLGVLGAVARHLDHLPSDFVPNLLAVRLALAPAYARLAVERSPQRVVRRLQACTTLPETPQAYSRADWEVHSTLTRATGNPIFTLILNGFRDLYWAMAPLYFASHRARAHSRSFYQGLHRAALAGDAAHAEEITRKAMADSLTLWNAATGREPGGTA